MAEGNVEVVRRWFQALSEAPEDVPLSEYWDADADFYPARKFPEAEPCHGLEEISQFLLRVLKAWSRLEWAIEEIFEVGDDRVLVRASMHAEGRGSGMELEGDVYRCIWLRHGRFFRMEDHLTPSGALHALGLHGETLAGAGLRE